MDYIGFLSIDKDRIVFRDITGKNKMRYIKYSIIPNIENNDKMYALPGNIEPLSLDPININIAEGAFDILGVFKHVKNENTTNNLYLATLDADYFSSIKYFISKGLVGDNIHINIYSDIDKPPEYYTDMYNLYKPWIGSMNLYYNTLSKDFGVPKDEISIIKKQIPWTKSNWRK